MVMSQVIGLVALLAAVGQIILMGVIGYPLARRRPDGMARFRESGFLWWLGTLCFITIAGAVCYPESMLWNSPSMHEPTILRTVGGAAAAFAFCLMVELVSERLLFGPIGSPARVHEDEKYEGALPPAARNGGRQLALLGLVALLEEFVFRSLALGSLWHIWGLPKGFAAGLVVIAFAASHWYHGFRRITIKLVVGSALVWAALTGGWLAAVLAHVALNSVLVLVSSRRVTCRNR